MKTRRNNNRLSLETLCNRSLMCADLTSLLNEEAENYEVFPTQPDTSCEDFPGYTVVEDAGTEYVKMEEAPPQIVDGLVDESAWILDPNYADDLYGTAGNDIFTPNDEDEGLMIDEAYQNNGNVVYLDIE